MPLADRNIRWGILGLGNIAHSFARDLLTVDGAQLYAVASRSPLKADEFASAYGAVKSYSRYSELAEDKEVDAVYIATPHVFHREHSLMCLEHEKAVLCEKPLAMNTAEAAEMIAMAKEKKVLLMEALWTRFLPHYEHVMRLLKRNEFGKVMKMEADFGSDPEFDPGSRLFSKELGGGSLLDIGIYPVFAALSALGVPDAIEARAAYFETGVDSDCTMNFFYHNGASAHLTCTMLKKTPSTAAFHCEKGIIKIHEKFFNPTSISWLTDAGEKTINFNVTDLGYSYEIKHFNTLLREGKTESPVMTFNFSRDLIKTLDRIREKIGLTY